MNKAGESWPSYETKPHLARHKNLAPTIDKGAGGSKSIKVGALSWDVNFVWFPGEPDDSVEDQREGGTSSAVQLVEGWFDIHSFSQDLRFWDFGGTLSFIDSLHNVKIFTETFQVVRLRRTMITRWRLKNTREGQQLSCRYWRHRWDISSLELEIDKTSTRLSWHPLTDARCGNLHTQGRK